VRADLKALADPDAYEAFTCLAPGEKFQGKDSRLDRDAQGALVYDWKKNTPPTGAAEEQELVKAGRLQPAETRFLPQDAQSDRTVVMHAATVNWNEYRQRWILIGVEIGGESSLLGEVWYAEAESPIGPWRLVRKIATHDKYSFYNPAHHPFLDREGGRFIYFEGTYSHTFSGTTVPTPRYDYNQIMYRLDLADPRLHSKD
jgi:hypothetical protein